MFDSGLPLSSYLSAWLMSVVCSESYETSPDRTRGPLTTPTPMKHRAFNVKGCTAADISAIHISRAEVENGKTVLWLHFLIVYFTSFIGMPVVGCVVRNSH